MRHRLFDRSGTNRLRGKILEGQSVMRAMTLAVLLATTCTVASTQETKSKEATSQEIGDGDTSQLIQLSKDDACWIDTRRKQVLVDGQVCLRKGYLEMFACTKRTKEHESVVAVDSKAYVIHAGLLAVGATAGHPVKYRPQYQPASGTEIEVAVEWQEKDGTTKRVRAQEWVRHVETKKAMPNNWVFAGSSFWTDPEDGKRYYRAESGELICVSNFPTAMIDLPIESTQTNDELLFEAFTEHIPPRGTKVRLILTPRITEAAAGD